MLTRPDLRGRGNPLAAIDKDHPDNQGLVSWLLAMPGNDSGSVWYDIAGNFNGTLTGMDGSHGWFPATHQDGENGVVGDDAPPERYVGWALVGRQRHEHAALQLARRQRQSISRVHGRRGLLQSTALPNQNPESHQKSAAGLRRALAADARQRASVGPRRLTADHGAVPGGQRRAASARGAVG